MRDENVGTRAVFRQVAHQLATLTAVQAGDTVCAALSGGADSVFLLRCLLFCRETLGISVTAAHINHHLRGEESDRDAAFCRQLCETWAVPLTVVDVDVRAYAAAHRCSEELAARNCRYAALDAVPAQWVATAHTASDNLETFLHRLVRGASLHGLTAIPPVNGRYVRPMLDITRQQVEDCLSQLAQPYVEDSTNAADIYTRNRIRHQLVPVLRALNPAIERTAGGLIRSLCRDAAFLETQTDQAYAACHTAAHTLTGLDRLAPALRMRCMARLLEEAHVSVEARLLEQLERLRTSGGRWQLPGGSYAVWQSGNLKIQPMMKSPAPVAEKVRLKLGKNVLFPGFFLEATDFSRETAQKIVNVHEKFANCCVDCDKIKGAIFLRGKRPGDRVRLAGRNCTSVVKKVVQEKLPPDRRKTAHLAEDAEGIFYVEGAGVAQRVAPDEGTTHMLMLRVYADAEKEKESEPWEKNGMPM